MKNIFIFIVLTLITFNIASIHPAISQTGYPFLSHFSFNEDIDYDNFDFTQDNHGNILIANRKGIITFDSRNWQLIPVAGFPTTIVNDPETEFVFVGTRQGFGYAARNESGNYEYNPIVSNDSTFETEQIYILPDKIFFIGKHEIRFLSNEDLHEVNIWKFDDNNPLRGTFTHRDELYFLSEKSGLMKTSADTFTVVRSDKFIRELTILYSAYYDTVRTLIASPDNKVFIFNGSGFKDLYLESSKYLNESFLTGVAGLTNGKIALSTLMGGCVIADVKTGKTEFIINTRTGLPDDEIFAMKTDLNYGLWLCHTKGLSRIDMHLPVAEYSYFSGLEGDLLSAAWFNNTLYVGTTEGAFRLSEKREYREKIVTVKVPAKKQPVKETVRESEPQVQPETDVRSLRRAQRKDRSATQKGQPGTGIIGSLFQKIFDTPEDKKQQQVQKEIPAQPPKSLRRERDEVKRTRIYDLQSISHVYTRINNIKGKCKDLLVTNGRLVASTNNGLFEIKGDKATVILPDQYITFLEPGDDNNTIYIGTDAGALALNTSAPGWTTVADFTNIGHSVYSLAKTSDSLWCLGSDNSVWIIKTYNGKFTTAPMQYKLNLDYSEQVKIKIINDTINLFLSSSIWQMHDSAFIRVRSFPGIYSIPRYFLNNKTVWLRSNNKWEQYGSEEQSVFTGLLSTFSNVQYIAEHDNKSLWIINNNKEVFHISGGLSDTSLIFDTYISAITGENKYFPLTFPEIDHRNRSLKITFSAPWYVSPARTEFRYYLEGLNKNWSEWSFSSVVEYPVLPPGNYKLYVQARNSFGYNSREISMDFIIKPPFWQTTWFKILAFIVIISIFIMIMQIRQKSLIRAKKILEEKVRQRTKEIERQKNEIAEQKQEITDSIHYAQQIQRAVLPCEKTRIENISDFFIFFMPRDIVSGDFYWHRSIQDKTVIVAADCTGHGVPGAFMSMLGVSFLNEIVPGSKLNDASVILNELREHVNETLSLSGEQEHTRDGMDIALCVIDRKNAVLNFAGANNPLYMVRNNELTEVKGDKMPIGYYEKKEPFTNHKIKIQSGDVFYIFSDGFIDQFGGPEGKKYLSRNFRKFLQNNANLPMEKQKKILSEEYESWRGSNYQIDDILVAGFRI